MLRFKQFSRVKYNLNFLIVHIYYDKTWTRTISLAAKTYEVSSKVRIARMNCELELASTWRFIPIKRCMQTSSFFSRMLLSAFCSRKVPPAAAKSEVNSKFFLARCPRNEVAGKSHGRSAIFFSHRLLRRSRRRGVSSPLQAFKPFLLLSFVLRDRYGDRGNQIS